jgi:hypothetical protein
MRGGALTGLLAVLLASAGVGVVPRPASAAPVTASSSADAPSALRSARASGQRVEVLAQRTELSQVFAEPSGRLTYEAGVVPRWVRQGDGSWRDVDLRLRRGADGLLRPEASVADVRFSSGGAGPLARLVTRAGSLTMTWPLGALPPPTLSREVATEREVATYAEVLPGVDLAVRATWTGFSHVLVVKTPKAAASAALRQVRFDLGGDARVQRRPDGSLRAVSGSTVIASAAVPAMWDSRRVPTAPGAARAGAAADPGDGNAKAPDGSGEESSVIAPADSARTAPVNTEVTADGDLVLKPDPALLAAGAPAFPLFIDPAWDTGKQRWAYATGNDSNNNDLTVARVGADPDSGKLYRSFFEFPTTKLSGKHIESAYVQMVLDHSYACDHEGAYTQMYYAGALTGTPRTSFKRTRLISLLGSATSHAHENKQGNCRNDPQPDMTINYTQGAVRSLVQTVANNRQSTITIGFCACNAKGEYESAVKRWKKFFPNKAKLVVDYDTRPGIPNDLRVAKIGCTGGTVTVGTLTPDLSARFPDEDPGSIEGTWEWVEVPANGNPDSATLRRSANRTSTAANTATSTAALSIPDKSKEYAFRVRGTDPAPYHQSSGWSGWCRFRVDTQVPDVNITVVTAPPGPGQPGTFRLQSGAADTVKFRYGWHDSTIWEVAATDVPGTPGKSATVVATVPNYGANVFSARAIDNTLNEGQNALQVMVDRPAPAVARWALETYPGRDRAAALADQEQNLAGDTPLTASDATFGSGGRMVGGTTATFNGSSTLMSTTRPVVEPTKSFSVAAWVRLGNAGDPLPAGNRTVVAQDGDHANSFLLGYRAPEKRWGFWMHTADADYSPETGVTIASAEVVTGRWTHLAIAYDAAAARTRIYVDGQLAGEGSVSGLSPWQTSRAIVVGREKWIGALVGFWPGAIADVQVFDRVLVGQDFTGYLPQDPASGGEPRPGMFQPLAVGSWQLDNVQRCYEPDTPQWCSAAEDSRWARRLRLTQGSDSRRGHRGEALDLDGTHYATEPDDPYHGLSTHEYGESQHNTAPTGSAEQWQNTPVLRTDESFTISVWVQPDDLDGTMTAVSQRGATMSSFYLGFRPYTVDGQTRACWSFMTVSKDDSVNETYTHAYADKLPLTEVDTGAWTHLVGVWDTGTRQMRLYVNGARAATAQPAAMWHGDGPLTVGSDWSAPDGGPAARGGMWSGGIDELVTYQGAMNDAQVAALHDDQDIQR